VLGLLLPALFNHLHAFDDAADQLDRDDCQDQYHDDLAAAFIGGESVLGAQRHTLTRAKTRNDTLKTTAIANTIRPVVFIKAVSATITMAVATFKSKYPKTSVSQNACHKRASPRQHRTRKYAERGSAEGTSASSAPGASYGLIDIALTKGG